MDFLGASPQVERAWRWASEPGRVRILAPAGILAATFLAIIPALALGFVFDDHVLIVANDSIRSWHYFPSYFTSHIWSFRYPHLLSNAYRPLYLVWLRLNDGVFGRNPWGWHLSLLLLHLGVTYLVYRLCLRLTGNVASAAVGGLIFGLQPVHVETIAEAAWADQPLSCFFMLAAILEFCRAQEPGNSPRRVAASLGFTAAALLAKESGLMLPLLVSGYVWLYGEAGGRVEKLPGSLRARLASAIAASVPFWLVVSLYVPVRVWALKGFSHAVTAVAWSREILTLPSVLLFYLRILVWPVGLSCYYDTPYLTRPEWRGFVLPTAILAAVAGGLTLWYARTRRDSPQEARALAFACLWIALTLLPVLNFRLLPENEIAHDRYVYLASAGFAVLCATALRQATRKLRTPPAWGLLGAMGLSLMMGCATARQILFWADDLTLNFRAHQVAPLNASATTSLGAALAQRGMVGPAMKLYEQVLATQPAFWRANLNLAYLYYLQGNYPGAARYFERACASDPTDGEQFLYLGMSLLHQGKLREAEQAVRTALLVRPQGKTYHLGLGMVLRAEGKLAEAWEQVAAELASDPANMQARAVLEAINRQMQAEAEPARSPK